VLARTLAAVAEVAGVEVPPGEEDALGASLPGWPVFPDARAGLDEAKRRGWKLAFLSNTDRDLIDSSVAAIGVEFDRLVVASEIGSYKPAHRHWEVFFERSGADRARHVHVAQSLFHDIAPANELGIPSVWINRLGEAAGSEPTRELPDLTALADCLDELVPS
jgi:2-haloacid dehalogenase